MSDKVKDMLAAVERSIREERKYLDAVINIRAAISRLGKKELSLRLHRKQLEWSLQNAEARGCLAGWVGLYWTFSAQRQVFPIAKNEVRHLDRVYFVSHSNSRITIGNRHILKASFVNLGDERWLSGYLYCGFFATRPEARNFVKRIEAKLAAKEG